MKIENINRKFRQLAVWILRHRLLVMGLFALLIAFSFVGTKRIVMKTSFDDYFVSDDPMLLKTNEFKSIFGNDYYVAVLVKNKDVFSKWKSHTNLTHPGKYFRPSKVKIMRPTSPK